MSARGSLPALIVIAKEPRAGHSKTRLCPPCGPQQAARLAEAALADTLAAIAEAPAPRRVLALDGKPGGWIPAGFEVVAQADGGLDRRLAAAFSAVGGPALLVGMDTPQLTPELLAGGAEALLADGVDAVLGLAPDGGYWAVGLREARPEHFTGVPMSTDHTGGAQLEQLRSAGLEVALLPQLHDVDTFEDAIAVAAECEGSRFALALAAIREEGPQSGAGRDTRAEEPERIVSAWDAG